MASSTLHPISIASEAHFPLKGRTNLILQNNPNSGCHKQIRIRKEEKKLFPLKKNPIQAGQNPAKSYTRQKLPVPPKALKGKA